MGLQIENQVGPGISITGGSVHAVSRSVSLGSPGGGGFVWNRPHSVIWTTEQGEERVLPIPDVTRTAQLTLLAVSLIGSLLIWLINKK